MRGGAVAPLLFLLGFAALLHGIARLCFPSTSKGLSALYACCGLALIGVAVDDAGSGTEARLSAAIQATLVVPMSLLIWVPSMLDLGRFRSGGRVVSAFTMPPRGAWRSSVMVMALFFVVFPLSERIPHMRRADSPEDLASSMFLLATLLAFGAAVTLSVVVQVSRLRPSALLERGLWLDGGSIQRWTNSEAKQLVRWEDVTAWRWSEDPEMLEIRASQLTGSQRLYLVRVDPEQKRHVDEALRNLAPNLAARSV